MELVRDSRQPVGTIRGTGAVRLTRRGRIVVTVFLLVLTAVALAYAAPASDAASPARPNATVVVRPGESLWMIAARYLPSRDAQATIEEIRRLNGLDGYTIYAGQRLVLPRRR